MICHQVFLAVAAAAVAVSGLEFTSEAAQYGAFCEAAAVLPAGPPGSITFPVPNAPPTSFEGAVCYVLPSCPGSALGTVTVDSHTARGLEDMLLFYTAAGTKHLPLRTGLSFSAAGEVTVAHSHAGDLDDPDAFVLRWRCAAAVGPAEAQLPAAGGAKGNAASELEAKLRWTTEAAREANMLCEAVAHAQGLTGRLEFPLTGQPAVTTKGFFACLHLSSCAGSVRLWLEDVRPSGESDLLFVATARNALSARRVTDGVFPEVPTAAGQAVVLAHSVAGPADSFALRWSCSSELVQSTTTAAPPLDQAGTALGSWETERAAKINPLCESIGFVDGTEGSLSFPITDQPVSRVPVLKACVLFTACPSGASFTFLDTPVVRERADVLFVQSGAWSLTAKYVGRGPIPRSVAGLPALVAHEPNGLPDSFILSWHCSPH